MVGFAACASRPSGRPLAELGIWQNRMGRKGARHHGPARSTRGRREDQLAAPALPPAAMVQDAGRHDAGIGSSLAIKPAW